MTKGQGTGKLGFVRYKSYNEVSLYRGSFSYYSTVTGVKRKSFVFLGFHMKLSILPRFYFHDALEQLKTNFHTNFRFKRILGFVIEYA